MTETGQPSGASAELSPRALSIAFVTVAKKLSVRLAAGVNGPNLDVFKEEVLAGVGAMTSLLESNPEIAAIDTELAKIFKVLGKTDIRDPVKIALAFSRFKVPPEENPFAPFAKSAQPA